MVIENNKLYPNTLKEITAKLDEGVKEFFTSEKYLKYLQTLSKFYNYSSQNIMLIAQQNPNATLVAGYYKWNKEFQRHIKKGEKSIKIVAPIVYERTIEKPKLDAETKTHLRNFQGEVIMEKETINIPRFKVISVFDVSQTDGKPLPTIVDNLIGNVEKYDMFLEALKLSSPVPVNFEKINGNANGCYYLEDKRIAIKEGMSEVQTLKTLIHEIAHSKLHNIDLNTPISQQQSRSIRRTQEVEAESIAYAVCQHFGLDTSDYSFGYIATWSKNKELTELHSSLETINVAASKLIGDVDSHFKELQKEQTAERETKPDLAAEQPQEVKPETSVTYYPINETAARDAKDANSFYDYKPRSAIAEYRSMVDVAVQFAEYLKSREDPMHHEKIDRMFDTYLESKLARLERSQEIMKAANAFYRKHKTLDGCPVLSAEQIQKLTADMQPSWYGRTALQPFEAYSLQNNNAEINWLKKRIEELTHREKTLLTGWEFDGGKVEVNKEDNRLQVFFEEKPDADKRTELKKGGFRWSPSVGAWQRQLNGNAFYAANDIKCIQPLTGERPTDLQRAHIREEKAKEQAKPQNPEIFPDTLLTGEKVHTPRGNFHLTAMTKQEMEAAGYGFHHQSDDGKYFIMGNGTRAFAVQSEAVREVSTQPQQPTWENLLTTQRDAAKEKNNNITPQIEEEMELEI